MMDVFQSSGVGQYNFFRFAQLRFTIPLLRFGVAKLGRSPPRRAPLQRNSMRHDEEHREARNRVCRMAFCTYIRFRIGRGH